jgi:hypothetical protein
MDKPVFFKTDGVPEAGLSPTVYAARNLSTGADVSGSVSVAELALGVYAVSYAGTEAIAGTVYAGVDTVDNPYVDFVFTESELAANKINAMLGTDGLALISTDVQDLSASLTTATPSGMSTLTRAQVAALIANRVNTVVNGLITSYVMDGDITVNVAYDADNVPTSETIV